MLSFRFYFSNTFQVLIKIYISKIIKIKTILLVRIFIYLIGTSGTTKQIYVIILILNINKLDIELNISKS